MDGWEESAQAWIASQGDEGDKGRRFVLDRAMLARLEGLTGRLLDVGCGEGRFCRVAQGLGFSVTGLDPTPSLIARALARDPIGTYVKAAAEVMPFEPETFDVVVSYLSLIDIPDYRAAIAEMVRVLKPGGVLLVANLTPMNTAGAGLRWQTDLFGKRKFYALDHYMDERVAWEEWAGIRIQNWHRPLSDYMKAFLFEGLKLTHFDEPLPHGGPPDWIAKFKRLPWFLVMEWRK